jgi:transcriptional regulator with XRE-family HTH domain
MSEYLPIQAGRAFPVREATLQELRKEQQKSQQELAAELKVNQAEISKMERRTDMYVSTLINYIQAMGGTVEITARFPDGQPMRITQFDSLQQAPTVRQILQSVENALMEASSSYAPIGLPRAINPEEQSTDQTDIRKSKSLSATPREPEGDWFNKLLFHSESVTQ